jgi:allantoicase
LKDFTQLVDLASERLGGRVIDANDDFFGPKDQLLSAPKPVFIEDKYTTRGKWMDGWETRRRRTPGHDWCVVRLGLPGIVRGIVVDTSFFRGNFPERFSVDGCNLAGTRPYKDELKRLASAKNSWIRIIPETALKGDAQNSFVVENESRFTHLRLNIYPDGGVARLRVHGQPVPDAKRISRGEIDLVAVENGGLVVDSSDQFFGAPLNLLMPYRAQNMKDGWETKRRRGPGHDWVVLKLGVPGAIRRVEVDTTHYKGNLLFAEHGYGRVERSIASLERVAAADKTEREFSQHVQTRPPVSNCDACAIANLSGRRGEPPTNLWTRRITIKIRGTAHTVSPYDATGGAEVVDGLLWCTGMGAENGRAKAICGPARII